MPHFTRHRSRGGLLAVLLAMGAAACSNVELEPLEGSTLPVPDLTKVEFSTGAVATNHIVVTGAAGAAEPLADVIAENETTGTVDTAETTEVGSFVLTLADAEVGHRVKVGVVKGAEYSDEAVLTLAVTGTPPPAPFEMVAQISIDSPTRAVVAAFFPTTVEVVARVANLRTGEVTHVPTTLQAPNRVFETHIDAAVGDLVIIYGLGPTDTDSPGPYETVEVIPR